jgi:hypothetical protein
MVGPCPTSDTIADQIRIYDREHRGWRRAVIEVRPHHAAAPPNGEAVVTKRHFQLISTRE